jgi:hypothetical protein
MKGEKFYRGKSRRGGRNDGRGGRGGRSRKGRSHPRQSAEGGNQRERIAIESGYLVLIDQFMLANPQFIEKLVELVDADASHKDDLIKKYGGAVVELTPGTYRIERDPFAFSIVVHPEGEEVKGENFSDRASSTTGTVFVDTRCLAMVDRELLDDSTLLEKYQQLWFSGQDKACRDLLRDNGGAVRYGFQRTGDELGVYHLEEDDIVCLWPSGQPGEVSQDAAHE